MRLKFWLGTVGVLLIAGTTTAEAQVRFAPQVSFASETDFGIGGRANFNLTSLFKTPGFFGIAEFNYFFPSGPVNYWEINGNLGYIIPGAHKVAHPYLGAGLNIGHASADCGGFTGGCSSTDAGVNLLGGVNFHTRTKLTPYLEARIQLGHGDQFVATGGIYF
ncbi:MAG: hypothetical protein ABI679_07535 [Gemmatimonadota bacterium]